MFKGDSLYSGVRLGLFIEGFSLGKPIFVLETLGIISYIEFFFAINL